MQYSSIRFRVLAIAAVATALGDVALLAADRPLAIRAGAYIDGDGKRVEPAVLVVREGKIAVIDREAEVPKEAIVLNRPDAVLAPGMIDIHVTLGTMQRNAEAANAAEFKATAADLFNQHHRDFDRAARAGVTAVVIAPASSHFVGGSTFVVKTGGRDAKQRLVGEGPLKLSLSRQAFTTARAPTSLQGGLDDLRRAIAAAKKDADDRSAFARWARGDAVAIVDVEGEAEMSVLARFAAEQKVRCIPLRANYAAERLDDFREFKTGILGVYEFSDPIRFTRAPGVLAKAGQEFAFTSDAPRFPPEMLRIGAAIGMAQGLERASALKAVTIWPAKMCGATERLGVLEAGKDADFVIYSGDPLDLSSRVLETFINGERVYRASDSAAGSESQQTSEGATVR